MHQRGHYKKAPSGLDEEFLRGMKWKQENPRTKPKRGPNAVHFAIPKDAVKEFKPLKKGDSMTNVHKWLIGQKGAKELKPGHNMPDKMKDYLIKRTEGDPDNKHIKKALRFVGGLSMKIKPNTALEKVLIDAFNNETTLES